MCRIASTIGDGRTSLIDGRPIDYRSAGSCIVGGKTYLSETSVPRDHPCHYCICYGGKVDCFWKQCAHIPDGCEVMAFQDTCNPSLYICDIPEKAREAPIYAPPLAVRQPSTLQALPSTKIYTTTTLSTTTSSPRPRLTQPSTIVQTYAKPETVVAPSRHLVPPARQPIEPPSRHLTPPLPSAVGPQKKSISISPQQVARQRRPVVEVANKQPAQFGLGMKNKMRFSRSLADVSSVLETMLPHNIQEEFPLNFDKEFVIRLVERQIRSKRSINDVASGNHHHHHHDHHEEDRGCTILGIHYQLGEVIGVATDVCRECRCAAQSLFCSPKCCFKPAPLQQVTGDFVRVLEQSPAPASALEAPLHPLHYIKSEFA
ncbi:hypothetical protein GHT06_016831 [Daphnia sinensis]|uniref:VWFC domain-containing protein n=1 Tax=Daphnia sinensis TaxID=1820382 RepID=A0AAD5KPZ6_9CRUS|nr:hypothetical protein GHT06_016831 [Daphnia sinensis]